VTGAILVVVPLEPLDRVVTAFVAAQVTAFGLMAFARTRGGPGPVAEDAGEATSQMPLGT
jgi:hypothetical protein